VRPRSSLGYRPPAPRPSSGPHQSQNAIAKLTFQPVHSAGVGQSRQVRDAFSFSVMAGPSGTALWRRAGSHHYFVKCQHACRWRRPPA
jgi:hypothetical protein